MPLAGIEPGTSRSQSARPTTGQLLPTNAYGKPEEKMKKTRPANSLDASCAGFRQTLKTYQKLSDIFYGAFYKTQYFQDRHNTCNAS